MKVLDLCSGKGGFSQAFEERGHPVTTLDINERFDPDILADMLDLTSDDLLQIEEDFGPFDVVVASPPCTTTSNGSFRWHWDAFAECVECGEVVERLSGEQWAECCDDPRYASDYKYVPESDTAFAHQELFARTISTIALFSPDYWWVENPMGLLKKLPFVQGLPMTKITFCQYGRNVMKPTNLWGRWPDTWQPREPCSPGADCHEAAPRGAKTGTQGIKDPAMRAFLPWELSEEICLAVEAAA